MELYVDIQKDLGEFQLKAAFTASRMVTGLLGASGCGKSLTLKCIAGVERPDRGRIVLDGRVLFDSEQGINLPPQRRQVGYLFQSYALFPNMTVEQNILSGLRGRQDRNRRTQRGRELCELFQLHGLERLRPAQLSGGQAQRAALARILASEPQLLLLDEPFSALDGYLRDELQPQLQAMLQALGRQTLLVTHSRDEAYRLCEQLCILDQGRVVRSGSAREVFDDPGSIAAARLTGCKNIAPARKAGAHEVEVPGWGICLTCERSVPDGLTAVGLRAHSFRPEEAANRVPVTCKKTLEEVLERSVLFRFDGQPPETPDLWWQVSKREWPEQLPAQLGIAPGDVLLLS